MAGGTTMVINQKVSPYNLILPECHLHKHHRLKLHSEFYFWLHSNHIHQIFVNPKQQLPFWDVKSKTFKQTSSNSCTSMFRIHLVLFLLMEHLFPLLYLYQYFVAFFFRRLLISCWSSSNPTLHLHNQIDFRRFETLSPGFTCFPFWSFQEPCLSPYKV